MATLEEFIGTDIKHQKDFVKQEEAGDLTTISGLDNLKEAIIRRLITDQGGIVHRPNYGAGLLRYQNAPNTLATQQAIAKRVDEQLRQDPRIEKVTGVFFDSEDLSPEKFVLGIKVQVKGYGEVEMNFRPFGEVVA